MKTDLKEAIRIDGQSVSLSFEDMYQNHKGAVYNFAFYLAKDSGEAEDLFQDTWLRIVKNLPEDVNMGSIKSWIFTIMANLYKDGLRKKRVRRLFHKSKFSNQENIPFYNISGASMFNEPDKTENSDIGRDIARAIALLPERQRCVFLLKEIAGFQQTEISDVLGMQLGTVKSLMHRAVKRLQKELYAYSPKNERIKCGVKTLSI